MRAEGEPGPAPHQEGASPSAGEVFLRQALGSNVADMRLPALLLTGTLAVSVVGYFFRLRRKWREVDSEEAEQSPDRFVE